jgi:WD40 repeat protein
MALSPNFRLLAFAPLVVALVLLPLSAVEPAGEGKSVQVVATLKGHAEPIASVAFSPDGKFVATASFDHTLKLWETATGKEVKTLAGQQGHQKQVLCAAFAPDGHSLASGGSDNFLKIWDVPASSPLKVLMHDDGLNGVALSPDGSKVAGAGKDGVIKVYKTGDYQPLFTLKGHAGGVRGVAFSPNNQFLLSGGEDGTARFWNAQSGQPYATFGAHLGPVNAVAWHPNNQTAYSVGEDGCLQFWQVPNPQQLARVLPAHGGPVTALALSPDNNQILSGSTDKTVRVSNFANGQPIRTLGGSNAPITAVSGNNALVAGGAEDGRLFVWGGDGKTLGSYRAHAKAVTAVSVHPQGTQLLSGGEEGLVKLWGLPPRPPKVLTHPDAVSAAVLSSDGSKLYSGGANTLRVWNVSQAQVERQFSGNALVTAVAISSSGQLLVSGGADGTLRFWDQQKGIETLHLGAHNGRVTSLALAGEGRLLSASEDGTVKLWQLPPVPPRPLAHPDQLTSVALSPDGERLLTGCSDKQVRLWNLKSGQKERDFSGPELAVTSVTFSPDGKTVAAGSADKTLTLWGTDGKLLKRVPLASAAKGITFRSDNKTVAAGLEDGTIAIVDTVEGKETKKLTGHKGPVTSLSFTPKGDALISASTDQTVNRWDTGTGAVVATSKHAGPVSCLALNREGTLCAAGSGKRCMVWSMTDMKEDKATASFDAAADIRGIDFGPTPDCLVLAGADNNAHVHGLDGKRREYFPHDGAVVAVVTHPHDKLIITGSADKLVRVWQSPQIWQRIHAGPVRQVLITPKGDGVLSVGDDKSVRVWSVADGKEMLSFPAHDGALLGAAVTADGTKFVTSGADKVVKLWELKALSPDPKKQAPLATHNMSGVPQRIALNPSGSRLAVALGPQDSVIRVYELPSFRELVTLDGHPGGTNSLGFQGENTLLSAGADKVARLDELPVQAVWPAHNRRITALQYHPNGGQVLTAGEDKVVILWDVAKRIPLRRFESLGEPVADAGFSRDGQWIAATGGKRAQVWNAGDGKPAVTIALPANGLAVALTADRSRLAVLCDNRETQVYEVATGKPLQFYRDTEPGKALAFHANNSLVRAAGKAVSVDTMNILRTLNGPGQPLRALAVTQNGANVLTGGSDKGVKVWNAGKGKLDRAIATDESGVSSLSISRNLTLVAVGSEDKTIRLFSFGDGKPQKSLQTPSPIRSLAFSPDDRTLAAGSADGAVQVYHAVFNPNQPAPDFLQPVQSFSQPAAATGIVLANDNRTLYSTGPDKALRVWKLAADTPSRSFQHPNYVNAVSFQPQGTMLASGGQDGKVRLFDLVKGAQLREINAHPTKDGTMIYAVAWMPDGKQILTAGYDNTLRLFDAASGNKVREFRAYKVKEFEQGHQDSVFCATISPDGKYVASGSSGLERVLKLWKTGDGTVVRDFLNPQLKTKASHPGWIYGVRFTRDGKYLVSVGDAPRNRGYLAVWNVEEGKLVLGEELPLGVFFTLDLAPESGLLAIGAGSRGTRANSEWNSAYLVRVPILTR